MKLPREVSGRQLADALSLLGYWEVRQSGSHVRLKTNENGEHSITVPLHASLKVGTLSAIIKDVAAHHGMSRDSLLQRLFEK